MFRFLSLLAFLTLPGCDAMGPAEETAMCVRGSAIFEGGGPILTAYQGQPGDQQGPLEWVASDDLVQVFCSDSPVSIVR